MNGHNAEGLHSKIFTTSIRDGAPQNHARPPVAIRKLQLHLENLESIEEQHNRLASRTWLDGHMPSAIAALWSMYVDDRGSPTSKPARHNLPRGPFRSTRPNSCRPAVDNTRNESFLSSRAHHASQLQSACHGPKGTYHVQSDSVAMKSTM
jgi:hypothetical protein